MKRVVLSLVCLFALIGCSSPPDGNNGEQLSKEEAKERQDGADYCDDFDWYGDGVCDDFCANPDPDCEGNNGSNNGSNNGGTNNGGTNNGGTNNGGTNNGGPECLDPTDPNVHYVGNSVEECMLIDFICDEGSEYFQDDCGCGCVDVAACYDANDPAVHYVGNSVEECMLIDFGCDETTQTYFGDDCGCGCVDLTICDDGSEVVCDMVRPVCAFGQVGAVMNGCYECVDSLTCEVAVDECQTDDECPNGYCEFFATCAGLNCPPPPPNKCIVPNCDDGSEVLCDALPPICEAGQTAAVRNGCYDCVDARTCM